MDANKEKAPMVAPSEALVSITHEKEIDMSRSNLAQAKKEFTIFRFGGKEIRVIDKAGDPWFVAKDVCGALELTNSRKALTSLDDDEKGVTSTYTLGGNQEVAVVSESGMYTLVLRCRDAVNEGTIPHKFRKWVTAEVLPAIRKTGEYVKSAKTTVDQRTPLRDAVNMLVGKKGLRYDDAYNMVHQRFAIDSIDELELSQIPEAVEYIHRVVLHGEFIAKDEGLIAESVKNPSRAPAYRYLVCMTVEDAISGRTEVLKGGANCATEIVNGTAKKFGIHIFDMMPVPTTPFC